MTEIQWKEAVVDFLALPDTTLSQAQREKGIRLALSQAAWFVGQKTVNPSSLSLQERFFQSAVETLAYLEANPHLIQDTPEWKPL